MMLCVCVCGGGGGSAVMWLEAVAIKQAHALHAAL
jgi:hypothetical protein